MTHSSWNLFSFPSGHHPGPSSPFSSKFFCSNLVKKKHRYSVSPWKQRLNFFFFNFRLVMVVSNWLKEESKNRLVKHQTLMDDASEQRSHQSEIRLQELGIFQRRRFIVLIISI